MPGIKLNIDCETSALNNNIAALMAMTRKTAHDTVVEVSAWILQSGANLADQAPKNRKIEPAVRRFRHGMEELVMGGRPEAPGDKMLYLIRRPRYRRPISRSGDRRNWVFETRAAAKAHQPITFRGIGKAGFWSQLPRIGKAVPNKYSGQSYLADVPGISSTIVQLQDMIPQITTTNSVRDIARRMDGGLAAYILSKVNNRISGMARSSEKRLAAFRRAGGVAWNEAEQEYEEL